MAIDLDDPKSEDLIRKLTSIKSNSFWSIVKLKFLEITPREFFTYFISLVILIPYVYNLATGKQTPEVFDTISKIVLGAYIGKIAMKD